jgi:hypothetical protein
VSTTGNNGNPGSLDSPWRTVQFAVDHVLPGATIYLRGGIYRESVSITHSGLENSPITLIKYASEVATIQGGSNRAVSGYATDWIIQGLSLTSIAERTLWLEGIQRWQILDNNITGAVYIDGDHNLFQGNMVDGSQHIGYQNGIMVITEEATTIYL